MKLLNIAILSSLLLSGPTFVHAAETDAYADAVIASSIHTYAAENALSAPDSAYADFREDLAYVTLDLGEGEEAAGDLTLHEQILDYGASYQVQFLAADQTVLQTTGGTFGLYATETLVTYTATEPYRYVKVTCVGSKLWRIDAVSAEGIEQPAEPEEAPMTEEEEPAEESSVPTSQGMLVKLVDDGNPSTTVDAAVYEIGADGKRHAFPSETVYRTWYETDDALAFIDEENLANYELGANVTVRPGTWLVKITTDPKVYAVEPGGVLRWITSEALAEALYGNAWGQRVIDVPDTFWSNYTVGDPITTETHPAGTLATASTGEILYLGDGAFYTLTSEVSALMRFANRFYVTVSDEKLERFDAGGELAADATIAYPY